MNFKNTTTGVLYVWNVVDSFSHEISITSEEWLAEGIDMNIPL